MVLVGWGRGRIGLLVTTGLVLALTGTIYAHVRHARDGADSRPAPGHPVPALVLEDMSGRAISLPALRGRVVLVNFWATWCEPCRAEIPELSRLQERYGDRVAVLAVNMTRTEESVAAVGRFVEQYGVRCKVLLDKERGAADAFRVRVLPTTFFIGPDGVVRRVHEGGLTRQMLEGYVRQMLR